MANGGRFRPYSLFLPESLENPLDEIGYEGTSCAICTDYFWKASFDTRILFSVKQQLIHRHKLVPLFLQFVYHAERCRHG